MEVRPGDLPGRADVADDLAAADLLPDTGSHTSLQMFVIGNSPRSDGQGDVVSAGIRQRNPHRLGIGKRVGDIVPEAADDAIRDGEDRGSNRRNLSALLIDPEPVNGEAAGDGCLSSNRIDISAMALVHARVIDGDPRTAAQRRAELLQR